MRPLITLFMSLSILCASLATTPQAQALLPQFGFKLGNETFNTNIEGSPNSGPITTFLGVAELKLLVVSIEGNLGVHNSYVSLNREDYNNLEFVTAAIARISLPIVPLIATAEFGAGLDQRTLISQTLVSSDAEVKGASLSRTMLPISALISASIPAIMSFNLEARLNIELNSSYSISGNDRDLKSNHELWILAGATF